MRDGDIDDVLNRAAGHLPAVDPALVDRVSASVNSSLAAVRPLPAPWILTGGLFLICAAVALAGAVLLGLHGIQGMSALAIGVIFPVLAALIWMAAAVSVAEVIPGSRRPLPPWMMMAVCCVALAAVFGLLFSSFGTERFVSQGMRCLTAGLLHALPASAAAAWLLHRGFAVDTLAAALAKGSVAGLAGVAMLELHCANFEAPHQIVWHIAVVPVSAIMGVLLARLFR